jgi:hypothetical protein
MEKGPPPISSITNLFLFLAETIAQSLNVTSCNMCGEANMGDQWPWEAKELGPKKPPYEMGRPHLKAETWLLKTSVIGKNCLSQRGGKFSNPFESLTYLGQRFYNATAQETQWWGSSHYSEPNPHPLSSFHHLQQAWNNVDTNRMMGSKRIVLDMWKDHLYQAACILGQGLCIRDNTSLLFPPPLASR